MQLYILSHGKSKKRLNKIMVDEKHKCENYMNARENSGVKGWHAMSTAPKDAVVWRQKTTTIRGSGDKHNHGALLVGRGPSGYISKHGFQQNT